MKQFLLGLFFCWGMAVASAQDQQQPAAFFEQSNAFFQAYAPHRSVRYQELYYHPEPLSELLVQIETMPIAKLSAQEEKAFYINAYNLLVIKTVVQHYPIASPLEVSEFWDGAEHAVGGKAYTLEDLEALVREKYQDPMLHFGLCKGAVGGVPIVDFAYQPEELEEQLKQQAIGAINNAQWITYDKVKNEVVLPRLFHRHAADFGSSLLDFLNAYRVEQLPADVFVVYSNEDWELNSYQTTSALSLKGKNAKKQKLHKHQYSSLSQVITLPKGCGEIINFNSIYTVGIGDRESGSRNTYFNSYTTAYYGLTGKVDIGVNLLFRSSRERDRYSISPFNVLGLERTPVTAGRAPARSSHYADWGLSHLGLQVRYAPFRNLNLSIEHGVMLPIKNIPKENTVDESLYAITQFYYIHPLGSKTQLFFALTYWQPIRVGETFQFQLPLLRGFFNYFATPRLSFYATSMYFLEWGAGVRYMLTPKFEIQAMYSYYLPVPGVYDLLSPGATEITTYNIGLRYRI